MFNFEPVSEEEALNLMQPGEYAFTVVAAEQVVSKKTQKQMIKLSLSVWDNMGKPHLLTDYLIDSLMFKIIHFCQATGLEDKYAQGSFSPEDCINRSGRCKIIIDIPAPDSQFNPKNSCKDYCKPNKDAPIEPSQTEEKKDEFSDEIPF